MYDAWVRAEAFYTLTMPILIVLLLICLIAYILIYSYTEPKKKARKLANKSMTVLLLVGAGYFAWGHTRYNEWIAQNDYLNPGIRAFSFILGMQTNEDPAMVRLYRRTGSLPENLDALEMYEGEERSFPFGYTYMGYEGGLHYFSYGDDNQYAFTYQGDIQWTEEERAIQGWDYRLVDDRFEQLGFMNDFDIIFKAILLPESEKRELDAVDTAYVVTIEEMYEGWLFGRQFY